MKDKEKKKLPPIGMRIIKSAIGVALCFVIYFLRGEQGTPFYSALAVLWCIQNRTKNTITNAIQRTIGTAIGAVYGLIFILFTLNVSDLGYGFLHYILLSLLIVPVIYTTVLLKRGNASYFSCVVYLSIVVNHLTDENPYLFVLNRTLDTLIGIILGLIINSAHLPEKKTMNTLYAADIDNAIRETHGKLTPYSRVELQNMIDDDMPLTFMTMYTPAMFLESLPQIRPKVPIVAMDGAILYDIGENSYPMVYVVSGETAEKLEKFIHERDFCIFTTVILEDVLIIYYDDLVNPAEKSVYDKLHKSPYRNYLHKTPPAEYAVVYFMIIDLDEKISELLSALEETTFREDLKLISYPSDEYEGYSYLKIYNKNASVENMLDYLRVKTDLEELVTVGDDHSRHAVMYKDHDSNEIVRQLHRLYY